MAEIDRRQFLTLTAGICAACTLGGSLANAAPPGPGGPANTDPVDVGALADFSKDGITDKFAKEHRFFMVRNDGKLYAVSTRCTHKGFQCVSEGGEIVCHKHNSHFSVEGTVESGPAKDTLPRYAVIKDDKGHVIVDPGTSFREKDFDDAKSFVKVS